MKGNEAYLHVCSSTASKKAADEVLPAVACLQDVRLHLHQLIENVQGQADIQRGSIAE